MDSRKKGSPTQWIPWILFTEKTSIKIVSCGDGLHMANLKFHFIFNVQQAPACSTNFSKNCDHLANAGKFWTSELSLGKIGNLNSGSKLLVGFIMGISFQWQSITFRAMVCSYESEVYIIQFSNRMDLNSFRINLRCKKSHNRCHLLPLAATGCGSGFGISLSSSITGEANADGAGSGGFGLP